MPVLNKGHRVDQHDEQIVGRVDSQVDKEPIVELFVAEHHECEQIEGPAEHSD